MRTKDGFTPKEAATSTVLSWIDAIASGHTADLDDYAEDNPPHVVREIKKQLIRMHNRMLDRSGLDGMYIREVDES